VQPVNTLRDLLGTQLDARPPAGWSYRAAMSSHCELRAEAWWYCWGALRHPATILEDLDQLLHAEQRPAPPQNYRLIGTGAQILRHLGLSDFTVDVGAASLQRAVGLQPEHHRLSRRAGALKSAIS
jgi:3,4-dihydroxy 2-butanone 4-phosphate synthase/GTP cyclohydrolase II